VCGGVSGAAGIVSGAGIPAAAANGRLFTEVSVLYTLSLAEVHGVHPEDIEWRRCLVTSALLGGGAVRTLGKAIGRTGPYWARRIVKAIPMSAINRVNKILGPRFVTKYGTKQGVLVLGELVPLGVGAALGAGGSLVLGGLVIKSARGILGRPPASWPDGGTHLAG
jgi:hypothetical protein